MKRWREAGPFLAGSPIDRYFRSRALIITESEAQSLRCKLMALAISIEMAGDRGPDHAR